MNAVRRYVNLFFREYFAEYGAFGKLSQFLWRWRWWLIGVSALFFFR
jgi:hypothetical protein